MTYTVVLPVHNETQSLPRLFAEIKSSLHRYRYTVIAIDDASTDGTLVTLKLLKRHGARLKIIHIPTRIGKWASLRMGISLARGSVIIIMDADLQDDPREIPRMMKKIRAGYDVVSGWRKTRHDQYYKIFLTKAANIVTSVLTGYSFHDFSSSFKLFRKDALSELPQEGSLLRYSYLFARKLGMRVVEVPVTHHPRIYGESKFGLKKYFRIFYDLLLIVLLFSGSGRLNQRKSYR